MSPLLRRFETANAISQLFLDWPAFDQTVCLLTTLPIKDGASDRNPNGKTSDFAEPSDSCFHILK